MDYHFIENPPFLHKEHALLNHLVTTHNASDNVKGGQKLINMQKLNPNPPPPGFKNIKLLGYMSDRNKAQHQNIQKQINQMSEHSNGEIDLKELVKVFQQNEINKSNSLKANEQELVENSANSVAIKQLLKRRKSL